MDVGMAMPDIAGLSVALANTKAVNDVSTAVLAKTLDEFEDNGRQMAKMMELSVNPAIGSNVDIDL